MQDNINFNNGQDPEFSNQDDELTEEQIAAINEASNLMNDLEAQAPHDQPQQEPDTETETSPQDQTSPQDEGEDDALDEMGDEKEFSFSEQFKAKYFYFENKKLVFCKEIYERDGKDEWDDCKLTDIRLPSNFHFKAYSETSNKGNLWFFDESFDAKDSARGPYCIGPLLIVRGEASTIEDSEYKFLVEWKLRGIRHEAFLPNCMVYSNRQQDAWVSILTDSGWGGAHTQKLKNLLQRYIIFSNRAKKILMSSKTGWLNDLIFVLPNQVFTFQGAKNDLSLKRFFNGGDELSFYYENKNPKNPYKQAGNFAEWQNRVGKIAETNPRLAFAISIALTGPLLKKGGYESGGFFHFAGVSSSGKTICQSCAASVWGLAAKSDQGGCLESWRFTANGLEGVAQTYSDTTLFLDELGEIANPSELGAIVYMLTGGQGKGRARKDGSARPKNTWRIIGISTGELGLESALNMDARFKASKKSPRAGQMVRFAEIPADAGKGLGAFSALCGFPNSEALATSLESAIRTNYGWAGPKFLTALQRLDPSNIRDQVRKISDEWLTNPPQDSLLRVNGEVISPDGQVKRVAERFALVAYSGELAIEGGVLPWEKGTAINAANVNFEDWLKQRGTAGPLEVVKIEETFCSYLLQHCENRFKAVNGESKEDTGENIGLDMDHKAQGLLGFVQILKDENGNINKLFWIYKEKLKEILEGHELSIARRVLKEKGYLQIRSSGSYFWERNFFALGKRCYYLAVIDLSLAPKIRDLMVGQ